MSIRKSYPGEPFAKFLRFEELCGFWLREAVILTPVLE
jgi:hypothetical protein